MPNNRDQIGKLADDIRDIRKMLYKNRNLLQKWLNTGPAIFIYLYTGLLVIAFSALHYYFILAYQGYALVPQTTRSLLIIGFIFGMAIPGILKMVFLVSVSDQYPDARSVGLIFKLFGASQMVNYLILEVLLVVLCLYFGLNGTPQYCVPVVSVGIGIIMTSVWGQFAITELMVFGLWLIVTGLASLPFIVRSANDAWIWMGICLGLGCLLMPVYILVKKRIRKG